MRVELRPLDEELLARLTRTAVAGAEPAEVMPPLPGEDPAAGGWTARREAAFIAFHRERSLGAAADQSTFAVLGDGPEVLGAARLAPVAGERGTVEAGLWLARGHRGRGVGREVLRQLFATARARWHRLLLVRTAPDNAVVRRLITEEFGVVPQPQAAGELAARITLRPMAALLMSCPAMSGALAPRAPERSARSA
jgi:RimJ/RimL family protein N-acetyltransferase